VELFFLTSLLFPGDEMPASFLPHYERMIVTVGFFSL